MPISMSTGSDVSIQLIKNWLPLDDSRLQQQAPFLPSRLVDVSQSARTGLVRIRNRKDVRRDLPNPPYVGLSYCWGNPEQTAAISLKMASIKSLYLGVPVRDLPQTLQDAISVTRRLGYQYLWIDSLCIIQDSKEDWLHEADSMREVYRNAKFTIAATAAWDSREGLFRNQHPLEKSPCLVTLRKATGWKRGESTLQPFYAIPANTDISTTREVDISLTRWNRRAWCFQEKILSHYIVYFAETQLHFESQSIVDGRIVSRMESQSDERRYFLPNPARERLHTTHKTRSSQSLWMDFLPDYTRRELTERGDKLIAIAGLIKSLLGDDPSLPERYVAGQWTEEFIRDLLWYVDLNRQASRPTTDPRLPTWAWASVDGGIYNDSLDLEYSTCAISHWEIVTPPSASPNKAKTARFGEVADDVYVLLRGKLQKATWQDAPGNFYLARSQAFFEMYGKLFEDFDMFALNCGGAEQWAVDCSAVTSESSLGPAAHRLLSFGGQDVGWFVPDTSDGIPTELYCLQLKVEPAKDVDKADPLALWVVRGLALTPTYRAADEYQRVGYFELNFQSNGLIWPDVLSGPLSERAPWLPIRKPPTIDPHGFFGPDCPEVEIKLI